MLSAHGCQIRNNTGSGDGKMYINNKGNMLVVEMVKCIIWNRQSQEANLEFFLHSLLTLPNITST